MSRTLLFYFSVVIAVLASLSSCLLPSSIMGGEETVSGEVKSATNISDTPASTHHIGTFGMNTNNIQAGYIGGFQMSNQTRIDLSGKYSFGGPDRTGSSKSKITDGQVNHTNRSVFDAMSFSASFSYPLIKNTNYKMSKMFLANFSNTSGQRPDSIYFLDYNFKVFSTYDLKTGIERNFNSFRSEFYYRHLYANTSGGSFYFPDPFNDVIIHQGSYFAKFGVSANYYVNSSLDAIIRGDDHKGEQRRVLQINAFLTAGIHSNISNVNVQYSSFEDGNFVDRSENVNPKDFDLEYRRFGFLVDASMTGYLLNKVAMTYGLRFGTSPGYLENGKGNIIFSATLGFGFGKFRK